MDDPSRRIVYISEILRVILDSLTHDKRSIVSLAYASKAVSSTALDYLWADMDSFSPFVSLLPKSVQVIWVSQSYSIPFRVLRYYKDLRFNITTLPLIVCPPPEEWHLFDMYAYRVRRICPGDDYLDRALYQRLVFIRPSVDLFPRLSSLRCYLYDPLMPGMKIFPSSLRFLSLYTEYAIVLDGRAELAMRQVADDAPFLEKLCIVGTYRLYPETGSRPLNFKKLHTVHLIADMMRPVDIQSFSHLLSAAPIRNLGISRRSCLEVSFKPDETTGPPTTFPSVEKLSICDAPRRAADIISQICSPDLKSVTVDHRDRFASVAEYSRLFTVLAQRRPPVRALELQMGRVYVNTRNEYVRGFLATLEPLVHAGLATLRVEMSLHGAWRIGEDVRKRLRPEAWSSLTCFEFVLKEA